MKCEPTQRTLDLYGLTREQYCELWGDGHCPVCGKAFAPTANRKPVVDHDHETGMDRGVVCASCNYALGTRSYAWFLAAAQYLVTPTAFKLGIVAFHRDWRE